MIQKKFHTNEINFKWNNFIFELSNLIFFWFIGVTYFLIFRVFFIYFFYKNISSETPVSDYFETLLMGFRFDCTAVSYFISLPFALLITLSKFNLFNIIIYCRKFFQILFVILSVLISIVTINYFGEYNDQFNNFLFLALYDDQKAVLQTVIKDFHPIINTSLFFVLIGILFFIFKKFENKSKIYSVIIRAKSIKYKTILIIFSLFLFISSLRGTFGIIPASQKIAGVSQDLFLNKTIINPFRSLLYATKAFKELNQFNGKNPFLDNEKFNKEYPQNFVTDIIKKTAQGNQIEKPKQLFLVIMESYDSWPLMEKYQDFGVSKNLYKIANEGIHFTNILPSTGSTFDSFGSVITGIPYTGVNIGSVGKLNEPYATSIFKQFKKLGYQTNLFYGGLPSWQNIADFTKNQGIDNVYTGPNTGKEMGEWGVEDEDVFEMVINKIDPNKYTLNIILTVSYHPPFSVDIYKKGFPYNTKNDIPKNARTKFDGAMRLVELGHLW